MDKQDKFFNKQYLETRLREIKEIKRKEITFEIEESNRVFSRSLYIKFYNNLGGGVSYKNHTLRISDHSLKNCEHTQFIVDPTDFLTKKKKAQFMKVVESCIKKACIRCFYKELEKISNND